MSFDLAPSTTAPAISIETGADLINPEHPLIESSPLGIENVV
jgi:hypothetical protein